MLISLNLRVKTNTYQISASHVDECRSFLYFDVPKVEKPEFNVNRTDYFLKEEDIGIEVIQPMETEVIRALIMNPFQNCGAFTEMKMMNPSGEIVPAHIPLFFYLHGFDGAFFVFLQWGVERLFENGSKDFVPEFIREIIDPKPVVDLKVPTYDMKMEVTKVCAASYSDAFHVTRVGISSVVVGLKIAALMVRQPPAEIKPGRYDIEGFGVRYHETFILPMSLPEGTDFNPVDEDTVIVVWNARGMSRPSFILNFTKIVMAKMPSVLVILESRISKENMDVLLRRIPSKFIVYMYGRTGLTGGVAVVWKADEVNVQQREPRARGRCLANILITGVLHPSSRRKLFSEHDNCSTSSYSRRTCRSI